MMQTGLATNACSIRLRPEAALCGPTASSALVRAGRLGGRLAGAMGFRRTPLCTGPCYPSRRCGFCRWRSGARPCRGARTSTPIAPARPSVGAIAVAAVLRQLAAWPRDGLCNKPRCPGGRSRSASSGCSSPAPRSHRDRTSYSSPRWCGSRPELRRGSSLLAGSRPVRCSAAGAARMRWRRARPSSRRYVTSLRPRSAQMAPGRSYTRAG